MNNTVGQKIKNFRKRSGKSQFELELDIDASPGSISRIESGEVNPTKETIKKIAVTLELSSAETGELLGVEILGMDQPIAAIASFSKYLEIDEVLEKAVDSLYQILPGYNGGVIMLKDELTQDVLHGQFFTKVPNVKEIINLLPAPIKDLKLSIPQNPDNYIVRSVTENTFFQDPNVLRFSKGIVNDLIAKAVASAFGFSCGLSLPLKYENDVLGAIMFTKHNNTKFSDEEVRLLGLLANQISISLINAKKFKTSLTNE